MSSNRADDRLRADVRLLGAILGDTLKEVEGDALFRTVERVRRLSRAARGGDPEAATDLLELLRSLDVEDAVPVARAFAQFLGLANIAEQHHRVRRRREYRERGAAAQRGSPEQSFAALMADGVSPADLRQTVLDAEIELVLTAHPTEVNRRTILQKQNDVAKLLDARDEEGLRRVVSEIWLTDEVHRRKPSPSEEARGGLMVFEQCLWDAMPRWLRSLDAALTTATGEGLPLDVAPVRFGSWMGGDRDGNPNVTADTTRRVCAMSRWIAADLYWREVDALRAELSLERCSDELRAVVGDVAEPYRELLRGVRDRLHATREHFAALMAGDTPEEEEIYLRADELRAPLELCRRSLLATRADRIADGRLSDILRRLAAFGLVLARLDIRQEAPRHEEALSAVTTALGLGSYAAWDEEGRQNFLVAELHNPRPLIPRDLEVSEDVREVLDTFAEVARQPDLGAYVISMASTPSDALAVLLLQKEAGVAPPLRVVPLFETDDDLAGAAAAMDRLYDLAVWRDTFGDRQEVMIGYSDSAKDAGRLAAAWSLYQAQEGLVAAASARGIRLTLFHGRGGSVGRGGGPMHRAILSQPPGSADGRLRVTEQGEMIQAKFGLPGIAQRTFDLYLTAVTEGKLRPPRGPEPAWRALMTQMADAAKAGYRDLVRGEPDFVPYFRAVTPEQELGRLKIGSRPARRRSGGGVDSLRAIPWIFAWTQTRLMLPSWLGVGEGLARGLQDEETLEAMKEWPFLDATLSLINMVLAKAEPPIAALYDDVLCPPGLRALGEDLRARCLRTDALLEEVIGPLRHGNPVLARSIDLRNPYVDPLNVLQAELLRRFRAEPDPRLEDALIVTINGIAAGMRNTG